MVICMVTSVAMQHRYQNQVMPYFSSLTRAIAGHARTHKDTGRSNQMPNTLIAGYHGYAHLAHKICSPHGFLKMVFGTFMNAG